MRSLITAVSLAVAFFIAQPATAQYSGNDDTIKVQEPTVENPRKSAKISTKKTPISSENKSPLQNDNGNMTSVNTNLTSIDKHPLHPFQKEAMTFYWDRNSKVLVNIIAKGLKENLEPSFGSMGNSIVSKKPQSLGYQYHFRDRWTMGLVYSWAQVKTDTLLYPDFDIINNYSYFQYVVNMNAFMGTINYAWYLKTKPKSTIAISSGIALGNSRIDYETRRMSYDTGTAYIPAFNGGINASGIQITLISIKQSFKGLRNFGYQASLGGGVNSIGLSVGINYTL
jgi:hypothetical protein